MNDTRVLITCPPLLGDIDSFRDIFRQEEIDIHTPQVVQTMPEQELIKLAPEFDGWIVGDDPVTEKVIAACQQGKTRGIIKWGVGTDNIDFTAAEHHGLKVENTPHMFGNEVADIAMHYLIGLARQTFRIDREVRTGDWPKYQGISLADKTAGLLGYGDIGQQVARRLLAADVKVQVYDPLFGQENNSAGLDFLPWPEAIEHCDFMLLTCALNESNKHILNTDSFIKMKQGVLVVNVARGGLVDESALIASLESGRVGAAALDVMEVEPLPVESDLHRFEKCIFGSHNASNTREAVQRTSLLAIEKLLKLLDEEHG